MRVGYITLTLIQWTKVNCYYLLLVVYSSQSVSFNWMNWKIILIHRNKNEHHIICSKKEKKERKKLWFQHHGQGSVITACDEKACSFSTSALQKISEREKLRRHWEGLKGKDWNTGGTEREKEVSTDRAQMVNEFQVSLQNWHIVGTQRAKRWEWKTEDQSWEYWENELYIVTCACVYLWVKTKKTDHVLNYQNGRNHLLMYVLIDQVHNHTDP